MYIVFAITLKYLRCSTGPNPKKFTVNTTPIKRGPESGSVICFYGVFTKDDFSEIFNKKIDSQLQKEFKNLVLGMKVEKSDCEREIFETCKNINFKPIFSNENFHLVQVTITFYQQTDDVVFINHLKLEYFGHIHLIIEFSYNCKPLTVHGASVAQNDAVISIESCEFDLLLIVDEKNTEEFLIYAAKITDETMTGKESKVSLLKIAKIFSKPEIAFLKYDACSFYFFNVDKIHTIPVKSFYLIKYMLTEVTSRPLNPSEATFSKENQVLRFKKNDVIVTKNRKQE